MYIIHTHTFKTQLEIKAFVKDLFMKNGFGRANPTTHEFLLELIKRHPEYIEKVGCGIEYFILERNPISPYKCFHLTFMRIDGSSDDISYNLCIKSKQISLRQQTLNAMRHSIKDEIISFKKNNNKCNMCGISNVYFEADHFGIEFKEMSDSFIKKNDICKKFGSDSFFTCFDDDDYKNKWVCFHNTWAKLQLLCLSCHHSKKLIHKKIVG